MSPRQQIPKKRSKFNGFLRSQAASSAAAAVATVTQPFFCTSSTAIAAAPFCIQIKLRLPHLMQQGKGPAPPEGNRATGGGPSSSNPVATPVIRSEQPMRDIPGQGLTRSVPASVLFNAALAPLTARIQELYTLLR